MNDDKSKDILKNLPNLLVKSVEDTLGQAFLEEVNNYRELTEKIEKQIKDYLFTATKSQEELSITGFLFESYQTSINIKEILEEYVQEPGCKSFTDAIKKFISEAIKILNISIPEAAADNKNYHLSRKTLQERLIKLFQSLFNKKRVNENIAECYLYFLAIHDSLQEHMDKLDKYEKSRMNILLNLWNKSKILDENVSILSGNNYDLAAAKKEFISRTIDEHTSRLLKEHSSEAENFVQSLKAAMESALESYVKAKNHHEENIDQNKKKYSEKNIYRASKKIEKDFRSLIEKWQNTALALADDWELELEISSLKFHILKGYFSFTHYVDTKFKGLLDEKINTMRASTEELKILFKSAENLAQEEVFKNLKESKTDYRRKLVLRLMPSIRSLILNSEIPKEIDEFEKDAAKRFNALSKSKFIVKDPVYDHPIERPELNKISPYDLVSFDIQPEFMVVFPSLKNAFIRHFQEIQVRMEEIPEIVDFSIESAIGYFEDKNNLEDALKVGSEGINRAINKIDDLIELRKEFYSSEVDFLKDKIDHLIGKISEITDNESALQIKIRITKAMAIERSKAVRDRIINNIKNFLPIILDKIHDLNEFVIKSSIKIRKQFEGEVSKGFITTDVSDYLAETEEAINRLPFVYQRLFKLEPLSSFDLYIGRKQAEEKIKLAYTRWKNGRYAPTIIVGEKGSGKTSFINRFLASKNISEDILYHDLHSEYVTPVDAFRKINESMGNQTNKPDIKDFELPRKILVIDGLEKLFEAKINGFSELQKLIQLISRTHHQIFWVIACHLYSYKYLEKSFNISDHFGYHIELEDLSADELVTMIEKRHSISGFRLKFMPDSQKKSMIPIIKQGEKNDQPELKAAYFDRLLKIVRGNITQAFLYWMRSAAEVTEDIIYINMPSETNLDIVRSISLPKFEILKTIVIHNGITAGKHAELFRIPVEKSELQLEQMFDDGIITKRSDIYNINPMIYKQVIEQMYNLNLLH